MGAADGGAVVSMHDGVSKIWVMRVVHGLNIDGFKTEIQVIEHMVRCAMLNDDSDAAKTTIRATVEKALRHMDDADVNGGES